MIQELFGNLFVAYHSVTTGALALRHTVLYPPDPAPPWFAAIDKKLRDLHGRADAWLVTTGPGVIAQVPEALIDYARHFQTVADNITSADRAEALKQIRWLKRATEGKGEAVESLQRDMDRFAAEFQAAKDDLNQAIAKAQDSEDIARQEVQDVRDQIAKVYEKLSNLGLETDVNLKSVASAGASLSAALLTYSFAAATAATAAVAPAIPVVGIAVAVGTLSYGAFVAAAKAKDVADCFAELSVLKVKLTIDEQRVAALDGIVHVLEKVSASLENLPAALHVKFVWNDVISDLDALIAELEDEATDVKTVQDIRSLPFAAKTWSEIAQTATNVQNTAAGLGKVETLELKDPDDGTQKVVDIKAKAS
jgi:hypothetical protein